MQDVPHSPEETLRRLFDEAVVHFQAGRHAQAGQTCEQILAQIPNEPNATQMLGVIALHEGKFARAEGCFRRVLDAEPGHVGALYQLAQTVVQQDRADEALPLVRRALSLASEIPDLHCLLGDVLKKKGQTDAAIKAYDTALELDEEHLRALNNFGNLLMTEDRLTEAVGLFRRAIAIDPTLVPVYNNLGNALSDLGRLDEAIASYQQALTFAPDHLDARANLACMYEETSRLEEASATAKQVLEVAPDHALANLVAAKCDRRAGRYTTGIERLEKSLTSELSLVARRAASYELGRLYDRADDAEEAFTWFEKANALATQEWSPEQLENNWHRRQVAMLRRTITPQWVSTWTEIAEPAGQTPVFLVGFPRSGTTLLDQILAGHRRIVTLEEKPTVVQLRQCVESYGADYPARLAGLDATQIGQLRELYRGSVARFVDWSPERTLVDRYPLNLIDTAVIERVFPHAKFILAMRHPADIVLSCFMQEFKMNDGMANFLSLDRAAKFYAEVMSLWGQQAQALSLDVHMIRYEDLLTDTEAQMKELVDFLNLDWHPGMLEHAEQAHRRGRIATASYHQVTEPIYQRARDRWRRYRPHLGTVLPALAPFVEQFGYSL